jgi:hypothetical protein
MGATAAVMRATPVHEPERVAPLLLIEDLWVAIPRYKLRNRCLCESAIHEHGRGTRHCGCLTRRARGRHTLPARRLKEFRSLALETYAHSPTARDSAARGCHGVPERLHDTAVRDGTVRASLNDGVDGTDAYVSNCLGDQGKSQLMGGLSPASHAD